MKIRLAAGAAVLSLSMGLGAALATPVSAHTLAKGKPYGCQINQQACATPGASGASQAPTSNQPPPAQLPTTGGAMHGSGLSGDIALPAVGLALALAGLGVRRTARRR
jgi:hypothetical protein